MFNVIASVAGATYCHWTKCLLQSFRTTTRRC